MSEAIPQPDGEEFTRLLLTNQKRIWGLILALVPNGPDADDVMQDACAVMWRKFGEFERGTDFGAWALRVARLQVMDYYRRVKRAQARLSDETIEAIADTLAETRWESSERADALRHCLAQLKEYELDLIQRRFGQNEVVDAISKATGSTVHAIYKTLARLQVRLLNCAQIQLRAKESL